jgi:hypothetical protein
LGEVKVFRRLAEVTRPIDLEESPKQIYVHLSQEITFIESIISFDCIAGKPAKKFIAPVGFKTAPITSFKKKYSKFVRSERLTPNSRIMVGQLFWIEQRCELRALGMRYRFKIEIQIVK